MCLRGSNKNCFPADFSERRKNLMEEEERLGTFILPSSPCPHGHLYLAVLFRDNTSKALRKGFSHKENPLPQVEESKENAKCQKGVEPTALGD